MILAHVEAERNSSNAMEGEWLRLCVKGYVLGVTSYEDFTQNSRHETLNSRLQTVTIYFAGTT